MCGFLFNDPLITSLKSYGYNVVRLPKANIRPLQVLAKNGNDLHPVGELTTIFKPGSSIPPPKVQENIPSTHISGQKSGDFKVGMALSLLNGILSAMGASPLGLETRFQHSKSISFQYEDILEDKSEMAELDQFLTDADVHPFSTYVTDLLESDDIYIITSTLKSKKFTIYPKASKANQIKPDIPIIKGVVGAKIEVLSHGENSSAITFEGNTPLVFGFQATRLFYENGNYTRQAPAKTNIPMKGGRKSIKAVSEKSFIGISGYD